MKNLIRILSKKKTIIGVIGLGYVGLPRCIQFLKSKFKVYGFETDKNKLDLLRKNQSYLSNLKTSVLAKYAKNFIVTNNFSLIKNVDIIIICLPTPINKKLFPELSCIKNAVKKIEKYLKFGQAICFESTVYPGATEKIILPILKKKFTIGKNFFLIYSPERSDPGLKSFERNVPKVVSGFTSNCLVYGENIYNQIVEKVIKVSSIKIAEMTKLYENIFRSVNISLVNEINIVLKKLDIEFSEVIKAASTKPFGFMPFHPGPGYGGHCIPIDPYYFIWLAKKNGINPQLIELSGKINKTIPKLVCRNIEKKLKIKKNNLRNKNILIIGLAYKKNINDDRESPAYKIIEILKKKYKCKVSYHDPYIKKINNNKYPYLNKSSITLSKKNLKKFDIGIIVTDHDIINYNRIKSSIKFIFDTRNINHLSGQNIFKI